MRYSPSKSQHQATLSHVFIVWCILCQPIWYLCAVYGSDWIRAAAYPIRLGLSVLTAVLLVVLAATRDFPGSIHVVIGRLAAIAFLLHAGQHMVRMVLEPPMDDWTAEYLASGIHYGSFVVVQLAALYLGAIVGGFTRRSKN